MAEELLPKPELDLPLPEKELPSHSAPRLQGDALEPQNVFRNKIFILFVVILFLVAFLIGGFALGRNSVFKELNPSNPTIPPPDEPYYQASPTPAPTSTSSADTSTWKTYEGDGYSFKYPEGWITSKNGLTKGELEIDVNPSIKSVKPIEQFIDKDDDIFEYEKEQLDIDGVNAIKYSGYGGISGSVYSVTVLIKKDQNNILEIIFSTFAKENEEELISEEEFMKIISTFKFTQ